MLTLTRKVGETVCIGNDVEVTVVRNNAGEVRLSFKAPDSVKILRKELRDRDSAKKGGAQ
jgi:carbon storage regulator